MGWTFRRSIGIGLFRFNIGKRGIGVSTGVRGARVGLDAAGKPYVSAGAYGVRYRKSLRPPGYSSAPPGAPPRRSAGVAVSVTVAVILLILLFQLLR